MNKPRVSPEQAKMLKAVGYDVPDTHYYEDYLVKGIIEAEEHDWEPSDYNNSYEWHFTRPTLDDAARWLREVNGWHVSIGYDCEVVRMGVDQTVSPFACLVSDAIYPDHDTALSEGISMILKKETDAQ